MPIDWPFVSRGGSTTWADDLLAELRRFPGMISAQALLIHCRLRDGRCAARSEAHRYPVSSDEFMELWQDASADAPRSEYAIHRGVAGCFIATSPDDTAALLIPLQEGTVARGRVLGSVRLHYEDGLRFDVDGRSWAQPAAVIDCLDGALLRTFSAVIRDVLGQLQSGTITAKRVAEALAAWDDLLRRRPRLDPAGELGLWGELYLISRAPSPDAMAAVWRGPLGDTMDFLGGGIALECKTSGRRLRHTISLQQASFSGDAVTPHLASVWACEDATDGRTLPELVDEVMSAAVDGAAILRKAMAAGYSEEHRSEYERRFSCPSVPVFIRGEDVPRVRAVDDGITNVRYEVDLTRIPIMCDEDARAMLRQLTGDHE